MATVRCAALEFGGFLGMDTDRYPLPRKVQKCDTSKESHAVPLDKDRLRIWRTRRLLVVIRIDAADLLTFAAERADRSGQIIVGTTTAIVFKPDLGW